MKSVGSVSQGVAKRPVAANGHGGAVYERLRAQFEVEHTLGWLFSDIHRLLTKQFEGRIAGMGLTRAQWRVVITLRRDDGQTQTQLADLVEMDKAPLGKILDKLEKGGWILRRGDPEDRRARRVYCTSKIDRYLPGVAEAARGTFAQALQGMREGEVKALIDRLQRMKRNLGGAEG